ncbi:MAG: FtsQ-type POTRA domain-containing protein [Clostridia bacterium]|nr:FtsQ-type POTRA domain-containing protein [Clostridia bacterium]
MAKKVESFRDLNQENKKNTPTHEVGDISRKKKYKDDKQWVDNQEGNPAAKVFIFFIILVVIGICIGVIFSPVFNLTELIIEDGVNVSSAEISSAVHVNMGENILRQNYGEIKGAVLALPYIKEARVKAVFPNKIAIIYEERQPYMILKYLESFFVVDKHGYLLEIKKENDMPELPVVYGVEIDSYELGETLGDTSRIKYNNMVTLLETAAQRNFPYAIYEINYETIGEVKMWVQDYDIDIVYGEIDKNLISDKLNYLAGILETLKGKKGRLDLSSSNYLEKTIFTERY